jgi:D-cysteine desulfhydrase
MPGLEVVPTRISRAAAVSAALGCEVMIKHDDETHPRLGGNKVRKLERILQHAREENATDLITVGAIGSNHLLATAVHGQSAGFAVSVIVTPHPASPEVSQAACATLATGASVLPAAGPWAVPPLLAALMVRMRLRGRRPYLIAPGGSSEAGTLGYLWAMKELAGQLAASARPGWPDAMVCTLGSGGMHAGLLAGARWLKVPSRIIGVRATPPWMAMRRRVLKLARAALRAVGEPAPLAADDVHIVDSQLGKGYGFATPAALEAIALFAQDGVRLEPTYTAKAAAALIALARADARPRQWLFWSSWGGVPSELPAQPMPTTLTRLLR